MNNITSVYLDLLDEFFAQRIPKNINVIVFFQGFPDEFYQLDFRTQKTSIKKKKSNQKKGIAAQNTRHNSRKV